MKRKAQADKLVNMIRKCWRSALQNEDMEFYSRNQYHLHCCEKHSMLHVVPLQTKLIAVFKLCELKHFLISH